MLVEELSLKAPTLLKILSPIVTANDKRKQTAVPGSHNPGLCMAVAILLKERNREMCGLQSIISLLLYSSHVDKQVSAHDIVILLPGYFHGGGGGRNLACDNISKLGGLHVCA